MQEEPIVSISSPIGRGAIAIVRMSGLNCLNYALRVFHSKNLTLDNVQPRYMYFGKLEIEKGVYEECLLVYFKAPFSYTGEDIVEFQIHGGVLLAQKVVDCILNLGVRLAEPGEFSKRAFLNGKITLDKAEAIISEINAESESDLRNSLSITNGVLADKILEIQDKIKLLLAEIEVNMDYPDETEETTIKFNIQNRLEEILKETELVLENSKNMKYIKNGVNVALVGKTNVGKSSIMNALLGEERSIVTDIQGTTRDSVSESFIYQGVKINLIDTAGIRQTQDVVESLGIEKSKKMSSQADVILFILDGSTDETQNDKDIEKMIAGKNVIYVINKTDKKRKVKSKPNEIEVSALTGKNIDQLKKAILQLVKLEKVDTNAVVLSNERQAQILQEAKETLLQILQNKDNTLDVVSMLLKNLWKIYGKITGNTENEDIIDLIFSKFCLGK